MCISGNRTVTVVVPCNLNSQDTTEPFNSTRLLPLNQFLVDYVQNRGWEKRLSRKIPTLITSLSISLPLSTTSFIGRFFACSLRPFVSQGTVRIVSNL